MNRVWTGFLEAKPKSAFRNLKSAMLLGSMLLALCLSVEAQQVGKARRIGVLISTSPSIAARRIQAFQQGLHDLGYIEGKNIIIEYRYAKGKLEPLPQLANELVRLKLDLIVTDTSRATQAAKEATKTIPVVFTSANDPLGDGQVVSLARPGGNLTGFSMLAPDLNAKRLEILKETVPKITQIGFLTRAGVTIADQRFKEAEADAQRLWLGVHRLGAKGADDLAGAFEAAKKRGFRLFWRIQVHL